MTHRTKFCPHCGKVIPITSEVCPFCGIRQFTNGQPRFDAPYNENAHPGLIASTRLYLRDMFQLNKRLGRADYWWANLASSLLIIGSELLYLMLTGLTSLTITQLSPQVIIIGLVLLVVYVVLTIAGFTAQIRRLHDIGRSGFFWLCHFVPFAGTVIMIVILCQPSRQVNNPYMN